MSNTNMMKKTLLFILLLGISPLFINAQMFDDTCLDAENATSEALMDGVTVTVTAVTTPTDDGTSNPMSCVGPNPVSDMFFNFNVPSTGYWEIVVDGTASGASGFFCATFGPDCASMADILENQEFTATGTTTTTCLLLTAGVDNILGLHVEAGGQADLDITLNSAEPTNDVCGVGTSNIFLNDGILENGSTACASDDANYGCAPNPEDHVVYYDYTTGTSYSDISLILVADGAADVGMSVWTNCSGTAYTDAAGATFETCSAGNLDLACVPPNTAIVIAVGSLDGDEGGFDLTLTETPNMVANDMCSNATVEPLNTDCTITNIAGNNSGACPEANVSACIGSIPFASNPVTWHSITMPTGSTELILDAINAGDFEITLLTDCPDNGGAIAGGTSCVGSAPATFSGLVAGNTYYIAVASLAGMEGAYDFDVLAVIPPDNDNCVDATDLSGGSLSGETNACASAEAGEPFGGCGGSGDDATVWYEYDVTTDIQDLTINLTTQGIADNYLIAYDECGGDMIVEHCAGSMLIIDCPVNGSTILIQVGSEFADAGNFDISVSEGTAKIGNDECDAPEDLTPAAVCVFETMSVTTIDMCPEVDVTGDPSDLGTGCNYSDDATSWYSFTTTASTNEVEFDMFTGGGSISVFENNCPVNTVVANCLSSFTAITVTGSTTYLIAATIPGTEDDFTFDLKFIEAPDNDDCVNAEAIPANGSINGETNLCASTEVGESFSCGGATDDATVWYTYAVNTDIQKLTIDLTQTGIADNYLIAYDACGGTVIEEDCGGTQVVIDCPVNGTTIWIQVGSLADDAGEFDISVTEGDPKESNDECDAPIDVSPVDICVFETMSVTTVDMCPEVDATGDPSDLFTSCNYSDDATSWYSFTTTPLTTEVEFDDFTLGGSISVFEDDCPVSTIIANCISANTTITVTGSTTYLIAATIAGTEGDFDFDIKFIEAPDNDLCADAEILNIATTLTGESTICASVELVSLCDADATSQVWYTYTVPTGGHNELTIDITNYTATSGANDFNVFAIDGGCGSTTPLIQSDGTTADYCGGSGTELITLSCLSAGDIVSIVVASDPDNEGTFDITINDETDNADYSATCLDNDLCADVDNSLGTITTNDVDGEMCITDCNTLACPDDEINTLCGGIVNNAVFYTFTTDNDPLLSDGTDVFLQVNINNSCGDLTIAVLEGGCGSYTSFTPIGCTTTDDTGNVNVEGDIQPNTTYTIVVGTNDNVGCGDFDLCVQITTGCANDECADAITLMDGDQLATQNTGCTMDAMTYNCGTEEASSAWYSFTMPSGTSVMNIDITGGSFSVQVFDIPNGICPPGTGDIVPDGEFCSFSGSEVINCLQEDTEYFIQVSSAAGTEVMFDITVSGTPPANPHDLCTTADAIPAGPDCEFFQYCFDLTIKACPEASNFGTACNFDSDAVVWASITLPTNAVGLEFENFDDPNSFAALFEDGCPATSTVNGSPCFSDADGLTTINDLTPGNTYNLALGNSSEGQFCFDIKIITPPMGDEPCDTNGFADDDFVDLGTGGSLSTTTCCAVGANDDPASDIANQECSGVTDDNSVWVSVEIDDQFDGMEVMVSGSGSFTSEVYNGSATAGCAGFDSVEGSSCTAGGSLTLNVSICEGMNTHFWIKVSSTDANCGDVTITATQVKSCDNADTCEDVTAAQTFEPITDPNGALQFECLAGCMEYACPEAIGDCGFNTMPVVWFQVTPDDIAAQLWANVEVLGGSWTPVFAIFEGECPDQAIVGTAATPNCNIDWAIADQINQPVDDTVDTYWVAVGADGDAQDINENPDFTICTTTTITLITCLGEFGGDCDDLTDWELMDSDIEGQELGPIDDQTNPPVLCQGESLQICGEFFYDASATGVDWLIGIVPIFGDGWDMSLFDPSTASFNGNGMQAEWFDEGDPILQEPVTTLCTYTDANDALQLCNVLCGPCPCTAGMQPGDELPGGWFWVTDGGNAGCENDGTPGEGWGIGTTQVTIDFCFDLFVRDDFADAAECNSADLTVGFQTFSDGVAGCWEDPVGECLLDEAQVLQFDIQCDIPPEVYVETLPCMDFICTKEICTKSAVDANLSLEDGSTTEIVVTFDANGTPVTGGTDHSFPGFGNIGDILCNPTNTPQTVIYELTATDPDILCPGPTSYLEVTVYPEILYELEEFDTCENGDDVTICVSPQGGTGNYSYNWSNGAGDTDCWVLTQPLSDDNSPFLYNVTVTDDLGCSGTIDVEVIVHPEVLFTMDPVNFCLTTDQSMCDGVIELPVITSGTPPYDYFWTVTPSTGIQFEQDNFTDELIIDLCNSFDGPFTVTLEVEDGNQCFQSVDFDLELAAAPIVTISLTDPPCDDGSGNQQYDIDVMSTFPFPIIQVFDASGISVAGPIPATGNDVVSVIGSGTYTFIMTEIIAGCINEQEFVIDPPAATIPVLSANPNPICIGDATTISVDNAGVFTGFEWSDSGMSTGSSISTDTISINTTYVVTATDNDGCSATAAIEVLVNPLPIAEINGASTFCIGTSTTLNGVGGDTYLWTLPGGGTSAGQQLVVTVAGNYVLQVTDVNGCVDNTSIDITTSNQLELNPTGPDICDGIAVELDAGSGLTNYEWTDGAGNVIGNTQTIMVTAGDTYTVTAEGAMNCPGEGMITINENSTPVVNATMADICNNDQTGASTILDLASLYPGIQGNYFDPAGVVLTNTVIDVNGLAPQTQVYTFTTSTATLPCMDATAQISINIIECICPPVAVDPGAELCSSDNPFNLLNLEQAAIADGFWSYNGTVLTDDLFDPSIGAGSYELVFTLDPANQGAASCDPTAIAEIVVSQAVNLEPDMGPFDVCNTDESGSITTIDLANYFTASDAGVWTDANGDPISGMIDYDGIAEGTTFTYTYTTTGAVDPCQNDSATLTIEVIDCTVPPCPDPLLSDADVCTSDGTFNLNSNIGEPTVTGFWLDSNGNQINGIIDVSSLTPGPYMYSFVLQPSPAAGCDTSFPLTLNVYTVTIEPDAVADVCNSDFSGASTVIDLANYFTASDAGVWTDSNGNVVAGMQDFDGEPVGDQFVFTYTTTTAIAPCVNQSATLTITVQDCDCPNPLLENPSTACNDDDMVDLNTTINNPTVTGYWLDLDGNQFDGIVDVTQLDVAVYEFTYVLDPVPPVGCDETFPLFLDVISQNNPGEADPDILHLCEGDVQQIQLPSLIDPASNPDVGGTWQDDPANSYNGTPFNANLATFDPVDQDPGTYIFTYGWYNNMPCEDVFTIITIVIDPNPIADAGMGGELNCDNSETGVLLDGSGSTGTIPLDYLWTEMNNAVTIDNPTNPTITVTEPGIYVLEIMDGNSCVDSDQVEVTTDPDLPTMTVESESPACPGDAPGSISITNIVGGLAPYQFSIDQGATWTTDMVFTNVPAGDYTVSLEDANGCLFNAFTTVDAAANPIVSLENDLTITLGDSYTITNIDLNFTADDVASMIWTADGVEIYNGLYIDELIVTPEGTAVDYCVFITDVNGCTTEDCITIRTVQTSSVYLPNIISTNSESENGSFFVQSPYVEAITTFSVFDRWGERIFSIDEDMLPNVASAGWNGTFKDKRVAEGVYVYFIELRYVEGISPSTEQFTGTITVIH